MLSDLELKEEFISNIKKRHIDQKFSYMEDGADIYYDTNSHKTKETKTCEGEVSDLSSNKFYSPIEKVAQTSNVYPGPGFYKDFMIDRGYWNYDICIISLGCGNSRQEKSLLEELSKRGKKVTYYGVDTSKRILELSQENLKDVDCEKHFLCADIMTDRFRAEIKAMTKKFEIKIYSFLGGTFCNQNQTDIAESISNLMTYDDLLRFDCLLRPGDTEEDNIRVHSRYLNFLQDEAFTKLIFNPLKLIDIPHDSGKFELLTAQENSIGALLFRFYFHFDKNIEITYDNKLFHFMEGEKISLLDIRNYSLDKFMNFLTNFDFFLIDQNIFDGGHNLNRGQFLFKKADRY